MASLNQTIFTSLAGFYGKDTAAIKKIVDDFKKQMHTTDAQQEQILVSLINRRKKHAAYNKAMTQFAAIMESNSDLYILFQKKMAELKEIFIAEFSKNKIANASYHTIWHGLEMRVDPKEFAKILFKHIYKKPTRRHEILQELASTLGAAHDIIQHVGFLQNEKDSAEIFVDLMKKSLNSLAESQDQQQKNIINNFAKNAIPLLAEEGIVNATTIAFNSGKRSLSNLISQIDEKLSKKPGSACNNDLKEVYVVQLAIELADTRRSEMYNVLKKLESIESVSAEHMQGLKDLLIMTGIINPDDNLQEIFAKAQELKTKNWNAEKFDPTKLTPLDLEYKIFQIEGFLIRAGQNIRMQAEFSKSKERIELLENIRCGRKTDIDFTTHIEPLIPKLVGKFSEADFSRSMGELAQHELTAHAEYYGIGEDAIKKYIDINGWKNHSLHLINLKQSCNNAKIHGEPATIQNAFTALIHIAAKQPGTKYANEQTIEALKQMEDDLKASITTQRVSGYLSTIAEESKSVKHFNPSKSAPNISQQIENIEKDTFQAEITTPTPMTKISGTRTRTV